jgi:hypothetical protein
MSEINLIFSLGNMCDDVLLATYDTGAGPLSGQHAQRIQELAEWFAGLSSFLESPLLLTRSLPLINKLSLESYLGSKGTTIKDVLSPLLPDDATDITLIARLTTLLQELSADSITAADLAALQGVISRLSQLLLPL